MMRFALIPVKEKEEWASNIFSRAVLYKGNVIITSTPGNGCRVGMIFNEVDLLSDQIFTEG